MGIFAMYLLLAKKNVVKIKKCLILAVLFTVLSGVIMSPVAGLAASNDVKANNSQENTKEEKGQKEAAFDFKLISSQDINNLFSIINPEVLAQKSGLIKKNRLPESETADVKYTINNVVFTAYNSEVGQCDDTPCITANGFNVCKHGKEDTIAANGLKLGTKIRIPELFGDRVFVVRDRMNSKYGAERMDIWMVEKKEARKFGVKVAKIEVLE